MTEFLDTPLSPAELALMAERAPHLVAHTIDGQVVAAVGVTRRTVNVLIARYPTMARGASEPAEPMAPTATSKYPATVFPPKVP